MNRRQLPFLHAVAATMALLSGERMSWAAPAPSRPLGIAGIGWGATFNEAARILSGRDGVKLPEEVTEGSKLEATGGKFAGQEVELWQVEFADGKFYKAAVKVKPVEGGERLYKDFRAQLIGKYGAPTGERRGSLSSDRDHDYSYGSRKFREKSSENKSTMSYWKFQPNLKEKFEQTIFLEWGGDKSGEGGSPVVTLTYENLSLRPKSGEASSLSSSNQRREKAQPLVEKSDL